MSNVFSSDDDDSDASVPGRKREEKIRDHRVEESGYFYVNYITGYGVGATEHVPTHGWNGD